jgi:pimeloyl-ACP methyl ester carboxylesterase
VICIDQRGTGSSDPVSLSELPHAGGVDRRRDHHDGGRGSKKASLLGWRGGGVGMLFAATAPERVTALVLLNTTSRYTQAPGLPLGHLARVRGAHREGARVRVGSRVLLETVGPNVAG